MGRTKTYTSASISNLNTNQEEWRYAQLNILQSSCNKITESAVVSMDDQRNNVGVRMRNYVLWGKNYTFDKYKDLPIKENRTYNEIIGFQSPTITAGLNFEPEAILQILKTKFNFTEEIEEIPLQTIELPAINSKGEEVTVTITTDIKRSHHYKITQSYLGSYEQEKLGEAYIWAHGDKYIDTWLLYQLITEKQSYVITAGNGMSDLDENDNQIDVQGDINDAWILWGYNVEELHTDEDSKKEVIETVFNEEEREYIKLKDWANTIVPNYNKDTIFYTVGGYMWHQDLIDAYERKDGKLILDEKDEPKKLENESMFLEEIYEWELEDHEKTWTEKVSSPITKDSIKFFSLVMNNNEAIKDPLLQNTTQKLEANKDLLMAPPISFKQDRSWINNKWDYWHIGVKAGKKYSGGDDKYYEEISKSVQDSIKQSEVAWVYLLFGLPTNTCSLAYAARYALQFFKMLTVPDWYNCIKGSVNTRKCGHRQWTNHSWAWVANYHFSWSISWSEYQCGIGKCPAPNLSTIRAGEAGVCKYNDVPTLWSQTSDNTWEYIQVSGYSTSFLSIKNGKSGHIGSEGWFDTLWQEVDTKRNFSKAIIPFSKEVFAHIPLSDLTDCQQYMPHIGVTAYKVVKKKWYQTGIFKVVMMVIMIVITVIVSIYCPPAGAAVGAGSVTLATVASAFLKVIISMAICYAIGIVLNFLLYPILDDLFGPMFATVVTQIISIAVTAYFMGGLDTSSITAELAKPQSWLAITNAVINGYAKIIAERTMEIIKKMQRTMAELLGKQKDVDEAQAKYNSGNQQNILTQLYGFRWDGAKSTLNDCVVEGGDSFIRRTLFTGSDIAENTVKSVEYFAETSSSQENTLGQLT